MNQSLGTFMLIAAIVILMSALLFGVAFEALSQKNSHHENLLKSEHQIKLK